MKKVKVILESKKKMRDKMGRLWEGMNGEAAKPNKFRKIKNIVVRKDMPKHIIERTERHEYIEQGEMKKGKNYKSAHKIALKRERKPVKGVKFIKKRSRSI